LKKYAESQRKGKSEGKKGKEEVEKRKVEK